MLCVDYDFLCDEFLDLFLLKKDGFWVLDLFLLLLIVTVVD